MAQATGEKPAARGPRRGEPLEVEVDSLAFGGRGVARAEGFVVFVAGALPGRPGAGRGDESEEALRRGPRGRAAACRRRPRPRPLHARRRALPRRPLAGPPLRAPAGDQGRTGRGGAAPDRQPRRLRAGADRRRRAAVALPQQARILLRRRRRRPDPRLPRPRPLGPGRRRRRLPPRLRGRQRRPQRGPRLGPAGVGGGLRPPRQARHPAQPRRPRGPAHGPDPDPPRHRRAALPETPRRPAHDRRRRLRRQRGTDRRAARGVPEGGALRAEVENLPRRLLPDQHRDGRAPLRRRRRVRRPDRQREGLRPLLRDRHDRADDGGQGG